MSNLSSFRSDLAIEAHEEFLRSDSNATELSGVVARERNVQGFEITEVEVLDDIGANALCKPIGKYATMNIYPYICREENAFEQCVKIMNEILQDQISFQQSLVDNVGNRNSALIIGLGNEQITPDAIGPWTVENILVTKHLIDQKIPDFEDMQSVAAIKTDVLGNTGIESSEIVRLIAEEIKPSLVIVIDALAARSVDRLCTTIQITDSGIVAGSGVGNARQELSQKTLGIPVIAIGAPTVVDARTLAHDIANCEKSDNLPTGLIVTPSDIDSKAADIAKLIAYGINAMLHPELSLQDFEMLLS